MHSADGKGERVRPRPLPIFQLPVASPLTLRDQICEVVGHAISRHALAADQALPSCRELAEQLNVSRNTVFAAYDRLVELGLLIGKDRSGYYVSPTAYSDALADSDQRTADGRHDASSPLKLNIPKPSQLARVEHPFDWAKYPYPFIFNQIDPNLFPIDAWRECSRQALNRKSLADWTRDAVEGDSPHLIQQLQQRLLSYRGIHAASDEILVTLGAQNAICIIALLLANKEKVIGIEDPGFHLARNAFHMAGHRLAGIPVDDQGLIVSRIPANCQLIFTTPSHQFPTAVTMSRSRRRQLLSAARTQDFLILEDDYEAELNLSATPLLPLRTMDDRGLVIYIGSLSKTISPGMRLGFMVAQRDVIHEARIVRGLMLRHAPTVVQETAALFLGLGYHDAHLRQISRRYRTRWQTMRSAIERHLGAFHLTNTEGGTTFWLTGPPSFDASALSERLLKRGVIIDKGQPFYLRGDNLRSFRLGFAYVDVSKINKGIRLIAEEAARQLRADPRRRPSR